MYSMVLMAALTTGGNQPDCHFKSCGCYGCHGCYGCGGCWGCSGCHGCGGCWGGCYGCGGCHGCGGCWGGYCSGGCYGCWGGWGYWGACYGCGGYYGTSDYHPTIIDGGKVKTKTKTKKEDSNEGANEEMKEDSSTMRPTKATLTVELPADAKLFIDDVAMKTTSSKRVFATPSLAPGQAYYYDVRAEVVRDGQTLSKTKRVVIRAGQNLKASFADLNAVSTAKAE